MHLTVEVGSTTNYILILNTWPRTHPSRMAKSFSIAFCGFSAYIFMAEDEKMAINPISRISCFGVCKNRYFSMSTAGFPPKKYQLNGFNREHYNVPD